MEEQLITFKTARLAKEKGYVNFEKDFKSALEDTRNYSKQTYVFYRTYDKNPIMNYSTDVNLVVTQTGNSDIGGLLESYEDENYTIQSNYLAPTQSLLQKWLRDIHFIDVEPKAIRFVGDEKASYYNNYINGSMIEMKKYNSYEEALEEGLYQALLLI